MNRIFLNLRNKFRKAFVTARLTANNWWSSAPVTSPDGPAVSLTTYGKRARTVYQTVESIAAGALRPSRLILWLDEDELLSRLPRTLRRLQARGLEIIKCENLGPHKKYYPYVLRYADDNVALVTADDDVLYSVEWLSTLVAESAKSPENVIAFRARVIPVSVVGGETAIASYSEWPLAQTSAAGSHIFPTGTSGVLYPTPVQRALREAGEGAETEFRFVDDVWLHSRAISAGFSARQVSERAVHFPMIFLSQRTALFRRNVYSRENDERVSHAYTPELVRMIQSSARRAENGPTS